MSRNIIAKFTSPLALILVGVYLGVSMRLGAEQSKPQLDIASSGNPIGLLDSKKKLAVIIDAGNPTTNLKPHMIMVHKDGAFLINNPADPRLGTMITMATKNSLLHIGLDKDGNAVFELDKNGVKTNLLQNTLSNK